jgi:hypothetical protein
MIPVVKYCFIAHHHTNLKNPHTNRFCTVTPIVSIKYRQLYQFCFVKIFRTNHNGNLLLSDYPGRVRSQIISVVCQIQWFDSASPKPLNMYEIRYTDQVGPTFGVHLIRHMYRRSQSWTSQLRPKYVYCL